MTLSLLTHFSPLEDPRIPGMILYPMDELLVLCLCGCISGADNWEEVAYYGEHNLKHLQSLLPYASGIPSGKTLERVFSTISSDIFNDCFTSWVSSLQSHLDGVVAIDGKTIRGNRLGESQSPLHIVSAFAHAQGLVLGQEAVDDKSNEITAIPLLLEKLILNGAIVTLDAMGCQRSISESILSRHAEYVLALKGNQTRLHEDVRLFFEDQRSNGWHDSSYSFHEDIDSGHGRIEIRKCWATSDIEWLQEEHAWPGLRSIALVESTRIIGEKETTERRLYISSLEGDAQQISMAVRAHWSIENSLHWVLDVVFHEDGNQTKNKVAALNLQIIKKMALNLIKMEKSDKGRSIKSKRKGAGWDFSYMCRILSAAIC